MGNVYRVGQVNAYIRNLFTQDFMLNRISVKGEVSNCKYHTSGHIYFSLKDETGSLACVMFAGNRSGLRFTMKNGQSVVVTGSISVYERDGKYQLYAKEIRQDGLGELFERFQRLRQELEEMGMFAPEYKQKIPFYARRVGIVTAPTGAAIRDIMNISYRRNPYVQLILYPALVQGEGAAASIVRGIQALDALGLDVLIVGRGGGSIEDLWAFNEEIVARAIFECETPVISAVGHETDFTIADYVADLRAPTPSAAAELAVADIRELTDRLNRLENGLRRGVEDRLRLYRLQADQLRRRLVYAGPEHQILESRQRLADLEDRFRSLAEQAVQTRRQQLADLEGNLRSLAEQAVQNRRHQLMLYIERLKGLSPLNKLQQGYSWAADEQGRALTSVKQTQPGELLQIYVTDGWIRAEVKETGEDDLMIRFGESGGQRQNFVKETDS